MQSPTPVMHATRNQGRATSGTAADGERPGEAAGDEHRRRAVPAHERAARQAHDDQGEALAGGEEPELRRRGAERDRVEGGDHPHSPPPSPASARTATNGAMGQILELDGAVTDGEEVAIDPFTQGREGRVAPVARARAGPRHEPPDPPRAARHDGDPVPEEDRLLDVVRHQDHGRALGGPDAQQLLLHLDLRERVERAKRLIQEEHAGLVDEHAREGGALGHAAGELVGIGLLEPGEPDAPKRLRDALPRLRPGVPGEGERDVALDGEPGEKAGCPGT